MNKQIVERTRTALLGALGLLAVLPAQAAYYTIGEVYQESTNIVSTSPPIGGACNNTTYCYLVFRKVPTGKQLIVRNISCQLSVSNAAAEVTQMFLQTRLPNGFDVTERFQFLIPSTRPSTTPGYNLVSNETGVQLYNQGQRPEIYLQVDASSSITGFCSIGGEMVAAPAPV